LWPDSKIIDVPSKNSVTVNVTLVVPDDFQTGVYQGFLNFQTDDHSVNVPVSFVVKESIIEKDTTIFLEGELTDNVLYGNGYVKGAFDMSNRYMAGDWRQYYFDIQNESINTAVIELSWESDDTNFGVFVMDPSGKIIQTNVPSGVFGHFLGWPSLDWLGNSLFSQGGGFYPVKNKDDTSTVLYVPINQTGTHTLLAHSTLFGGNSTTETITLAAKFTNIPDDLIMNFENNSELKSTITDSEYSEVISKSNDQTLLISNNDTLIISESKSDLGFDIGLLVGITIGVAIGIFIIFIIRQKNT
jgi:hypothetical protein